MKYYIAGPCDSNNRYIMHEVKQAIETFKEKDDSIYYPFEFKVENAWDFTQEVWAQKVYDNDIKHIREADVLIVISLGRTSSAGTNFEQGYAAALNKKIYVIQVTDQPTSLMTYCGSTYFYSASIDTIWNTIQAIFKYPSSLKIHCDTVLT